MDKSNVRSAMLAVLYNSTHDNLDALIVSLGLTPEDEIHRNKIMNIMFAAIDGRRDNEDKTLQTLLAAV